MANVLHEYLDMKSDTGFNVMYQLEVVTSDKSFITFFVEADGREKAIKAAYKKFHPCLVLKTEEIF